LKNKDTERIKKLKEYFKDHFSNTDKFCHARIPGGDCHFLISAALPTLWLTAVFI
jgi:hypothetical protein